MSSEQTNDTPAEQADRAWNADEWLPPKYRNPAYRPPSIRPVTENGDAPFVVLPTADGGFEPVNNRIVHIEHEGRQVPLIVLTPKQRWRRRLIFNLVAAVISLVILWLVNWLLTR